MSSTERAPEPTMEEILASIRRIISDDEASSVQQRATSSEYAEQVRADDTEDGAADTQMIDHLARALGGGAKPAANDDEVDDILDLTDAGGSASEDVIMADEPVAVLDEVVLETESYVETRPKLDFSAAFPPQEQSPPEPAQNYEAPPSYEAAPTYAEPTPSYEEPSQSYADEPAIVVEMPAAGPPVTAQPAPTLDDPTTALERAIAALKAGDLAAFAREAQSDYAAPEPTYVAPASIYAAPQPEPEAPVAEFQSEHEPLSFEPEPEPTLVIEEETVVFLDEPEPKSSVPAWTAETPSWSQIVEPAPEPESESEPEPEPAPWRSEDFSWGRTTPANEFELNPARVNGGSDHEPHDFAEPVSSKSLEDSVKEMLRPLLKQWLDENMPRVLTAALREELENFDTQRRDG
jgi:cell pole-organizing protein PopZ